MYLLTGELDEASVATLGLLKSPSWVCHVHMSHTSPGRLAGACSQANPRETREEAERFCKVSVSVRLATVPLAKGALMV